MTLTPDPHGQAALMLCECLACILVEHGLVSTGQVIDAIEGVVEIKQEIAGTSESVVGSIASIALLRAVARSLPAESGLDVSAKA